ncbi:MAG: hypothetical protein Q9220_005457 [cf. Caloplaca sp. 1 TL-2023]
MSAFYRSSNAHRYTYFLVTKGGRHYLRSVGPTSMLLKWVINSDLAHPGISYTVHIYHPLGNRPLPPESNLWNPACALDVSRFLHRIRDLLRYLSSPDIISLVPSGREIDALTLLLHRRDWRGNYPWYAIARQVWEELFAPFLTLSADDAQGVNDMEWKIRAGCWDLMRQQRRRDEPDDSDSGGGEDYGIDSLPWRMLSKREARDIAHIRQMLYNGLKAEERRQQRVFSIDQIYKMLDLAWPLEGYSSQESDLPSPANLILHGTEATGKSFIINELLEAIRTPSALIQCKECITTRHLLERTLSQVRNALSDSAPPIDGRCESISTFVVQLQRLLEGCAKFILVFDNVDRQREPTPTLLPALARLGEMIPNLTTIFILTFPHPSLFHLPGIPHIHFPAYTRSELLSLIASSPLPLQSSSLTFHPADFDYLWPRFATAVHDSLSRPASRTLPGLRTLCARLWPLFIAPILEGQYTPREFSKLMIRNRHLFQSETALKESIIVPQPSIPAASSAAQHNLKQQHKNLITTENKAFSLNLPLLPAQLLITAYLASHTHPKNDTLLFSNA